LADNRLLHWRNLWNQYDGQGNLTRRREGATEQYYQYDADNRLVAARGRGPQGEFVARYGYDALGRRTGKTVTWCESGKQEETHFLWEGYRLLQVRQPDRKESYVYDPTVWWSPLARITQRPGAREGVHHGPEWRPAGDDGCGRLGPLERRLRQLWPATRADAGQ
ncbi:hypothetical protein HLB28_13665, partial [Dickeya dadantii]|nr:hypothetical protein [Dickeya dadantii]